MKKKLLSILLGCTLMLTGCTVESSPNGNNNGNKDSQTTENETVPNDMLYGMCYIANERDDVSKYAKLDTELMYRLGVGSVRNWLHITDMLQSKTTVKKDACDKMHAILKEQKEKKMVIIGMSHTNFNNGTAISGKPKRDTTSGSYYVSWLRDYYSSWKTLVNEFPEVEYWEIDNEINNNDFMKNTNGEVVYSVKDMADISADMLYYASRAIRSANPKAKTVMGGITEPRGLGHGENVEFMQYLYQNITSGNYGYMYGLEDKSKASTNPDDYFQVACWHPYVSGKFDKEYFIAENNKIYDVILSYEPEGKDVLFTEIGFSNASRTEEQTAREIAELYECVKNDLTYVKAVTYFKLFDVAKQTWTGQYSRYGLFYDPYDRPYTQAVGDDTTTLLKNGAPKLAAYAYQQVANGSGDITFLTRK